MVGKTMCNFSKKENPMKTLIALFTLLALAACSTPATSSEEQEASVAASSTTQSKTAVKTWNVVGIKNNIAVRGVDAAGKSIHTLESLKNSDGSVTATFTYRDAAGTTQASRSFTIGKDKKPVSGIPVQQLDENLCPGCMNDDLKSGLTNASQQSVKPQVVSTACRNARRNLTKALNASLNACRPTPLMPIIDDSACFIAMESVMNAQSDVDMACG